MCLWKTKQNYFKTFTDRVNQKAKSFGEPKAYIPIGPSCVEYFNPTRHMVQERGPGILITRKAKMVILQIWALLTLEFYPCIKKL